MKTIRLLLTTLLAMAGFVFTSQAQIQTAGNVLVNLDSTNLTAGQFLSITNTGTLGGVFEAIGSPTNELPIAVNVDGGTLAMMFDGREHLEHLASLAVTNGVTTNAAAAVPAPSQITGTNPACSIEVWAYNPTIAPREDMVGWGRTGGTNSLLAFSYGCGLTTGGAAVDRNAAGVAGPSDSAFGGPNLSWGTSVPSAGAWHHLVYTFSGSGKVNKLYVDGARVVTWTNFLDVVTWAGTNITVAATRGGGGVNGPANGNNGGMAIAKVRIMDGVLSDANVLNNFLFERPGFTNNITTPLVSGPIHRYSFNQPATNDAVNVVIPDTGTAPGASGMIRGTPGAGTSGAVFDGTKLQLAGGASSTGFSPAYVDLPNGLLSNLSTFAGGPGKVTFEGWVTLKGAWTWCSFFSFGTCSAGEQTGPNLTAVGYGGQNYLNWGFNANSTSVQRFELTGNAPNLHDVNVADQDFFPVGLQHWAISWDEPSGTMTLYLNGNLLSQAHTAGPFTNVVDVNNWLGRDNWNGDNYLQGDYSEFRIYNRILSPGEIATDYAYGPAGVWTNLSDVGTLSSIQIQPLAYTNNWVGMASPLRVTASYTGTGGWQRDVGGDPTTVYQSDATGVATVSSNGLLSLVGTGSANISAIFGGKTNTMAVSVSNAPAATLIHRYTFNQPDLSTTATDSVGTADGTFTTTFVVGNKAQLGSGGFVTFPTNLVLGPGALTIEAWADFNTNAANAVLWSFGDQNPITGNGRNGIMLTERNGTRTFAFPGADPGFAHEENGARVIGGVSGYGFTGPGNGAVGLDNLTNLHLVGVYNPNLGYVQMFINGQLQAQANGLRPLSGLSGNLNYLGHSLYNDPLLNGAIDEFRIWSGALSPQQVALNTAAGPNNIVTSPGVLNTVVLTIPSTNTIKTVVQQATFIGNFANITGVNLFTYGDTNVTITSDNPTVLTVSPAGVVTAVAQGVAHVVASFGGKSSTNTVTVADPAPTMIHRYTFNTNANDVVGTANGAFQGSANTNGLGQVVLNSSTGDYVQLPVGIISGLFAVTIEAYVTSFGTNTPGSWLYGFGDEDVGTLFGHDYIYYSPHVGNNARAGISVGSTPGTGNEQNVTVTGGQLDSRSNVVITVVQHPFLGFQQVYVNGALVATNTMSSLLSSVSSNLNFIGRSLYDNPTGAYPSQSYLNATIDDFRIYSGVLSSNQIALDAAAGANNIVTNPGAFSSVSIVLPTNTLPFGGSETIAVLGNFANVSGVNLFTYGGLGNVTVTSSDSNVVTVAPGGLLTAVATGTANIIASVTNVTATNKITVLGSRSIALKNRWSFTTDATDSVGGQNGTLMGTAAISGGSLVLTGGANGTGYLNLPNGLVSVRTNATFEVWARRNAVATWARLFDFGTSGTEDAVGNGSSYAFLVADNGQNVPRFAFTTNGAGAENPILTAGAAVVNGATNLYTVVYDFTSNFSAFYINGVQQATGVTPLPLSGVIDNNDWIGRSQYGADPDFNGTIDEVRIWEGRMYPGEIAQEFTNGPASLPFPTLSASNGVGTTTLAWPYTFARYALQSNTNLSTTNWVTITNSPVTTNGIRRVTLPAAVSGSVFYRLSGYNQGQ